MSLVALIASVPAMVAFVAIEHTARDPMLPLSSALSGRLTGRIGPRRPMLLGTLLASGAFVPGLHAAMAVSAGAFLAGALVTAVAVDRDRPAGLGRQAS